MNAEKFIMQLDTLFSKGEIDKVAPFIKEQLALSYQEKDYNTCITILNEAIGFFRDLSLHDQSIAYAKEALTLFNTLCLTDTVAYATTVLNVANALRAAGELDKSLIFHEKSLAIFQQHLEEDDERIASVYNNVALLYQEMQAFDKACEASFQALQIIKTKNDPIKLAITYTNLASSMLNLQKVEEALSYLLEAQSIFEKDSVLDFHYSACMSALGQAFTLKNDLETARSCYQIALKEQHSHCGKSDGYYRILQNLQFVEKELGVALTLEQMDASHEETLPPSNHIKGLTLCKRFFEEVALPVLKEQMPKALTLAAFGLMGEGSECLGFDDAISTDHDFGPGFCIFLEKKDWDTYAEPLTKLYNALPKEFLGYKRLEVRGAHRVGVICVEDFCRRFLGAPTAKEWEKVMLLNLKTADDRLFYNFFSGEIFMDASRMFTELQMKIRNLLENELSDYWLYKQIVSLRTLSQLGQCNYNRMYDRQDYLTANLLKHKFIEECLKYIHIVNHKLLPYDKWLKKSASTCTLLSGLMQKVEILSKEENHREVATIIEEICTEIANELNENSHYLFQTEISEDNFLDHYANAMLSFTKEEKEKLVEELVALEWSAFDKVENENGRASCQNNYPTFSIMRKSQYRTWNIPMLLSFIKDFQEANARCWNLITEKYGRMMASTAPEQYKELAPFFKSHTEKQLAIVENIVNIQVQWMEEFIQKYPAFSTQTRLIHTQEDEAYDTSYETYLRGELLTYSERTLILYANFIVSLLKKEENLAQKTILETVKQYGYASLEEYCKSTITK